jgi:hypothetical protein
MWSAHGAAGTQEPLAVHRDPAALVAAAHSASVAHARQVFAAQIGAAAAVQSPLLRNTPPDEPPMQKRCLPVPEQAAFDPQRHSRFVQALERSGSHAGAEQAAHCATLVRTQAATPAFSQHSWLFVQPRAPSGSQAPHCPF